MHNCLEAVWKPGANANNPDVAHVDMILYVNFDVAIEDHHEEDPA